MNLPRVAILVASVVAIVAPATADAAPAPSNGPTPLGGTKWPVKVIRYYVAAPAIYHEGITLGVRELNGARLGIRFARISTRSGAHLLIKAHPFPGNVAGDAHLGYTRGATLRLDTALVATALIQQGNTILDTPDFAVPEVIASVVVHELGHVLGLKHTRGCSIMAIDGDVARGCNYARVPGTWTCRMLQTRDLAALRRRYGGIGVRRRAVNCPWSTTRAGRVTPTSSGPDGEYAIRIGWRDVTNVFGYRFARSTPGGACPVSATGATRLDELGGTLRIRVRGEDLPVSGSYCYSIWSENGRGMLTGPSTIRVTAVAPIPPFTPPVTNVAAVVETSGHQGSTVRLTWNAPAGTDAVFGYRYAADGSCRDPQNYRAFAVAGSVTTAQLTGVPGGTWTWALLAQDADDSTPISVPTCVTVAIPQPPEMADSGA